MPPSSPAPRLHCAASSQPPAVSAQDRPPRQKDLTHDHAFPRNLRDKGQPFPLTGLLWAVFAPKLLSGLAEVGQFCVAVQLLPMPVPRSACTGLIYNNILYPDSPVRRGEVGWAQWKVGDEPEAPAPSPLGRRPEPLRDHGKEGRRLWAMIGQPSCSAHPGGWDSASTTSQGPQSRIY